MTDLPTRRAMLTTSVLAASGFLTLDTGLAQPLSPTPECHDGDAATLRQTEGRSSSRPRRSARN